MLTIFYESSNLEVKFIEKYEKRKYTVILDTNDMEYNSYIRITDDCSVTIYNTGKGDKILCE